MTADGIVLDRIEDAIADIAAGRAVIVVDDEDPHGGAVRAGEGLVGSGHG